MLSMILLNHCCVRPQREHPNDLTNYLAPATMGDLRFYSTPSSWACLCPTANVPALSPLTVTIARVHRRQLITDVLVLYVCVFGILYALTLCRFLLIHATVY